MYRTIAMALVLCLIAPGARADPIGKGIDLGPLAEHFTLLTGDVDWTGESYTVTLKLQAKKDLDTADLFFQVGFFDKSKLLLQGTPLKFDQGFPLLKGESVFASCSFTRGLYQEEGFPWHMIFIRAGKKPG